MCSNPEKMLTTKGSIEKDAHAIHNNRSHQFKDETIQKILEHVSFLKGRSAYYYLHNTKKMYLPETLHISKLLHISSKSP